MVGIGNTLAGDDGAGIVAVRRLRERFGLPGGVDLLELPGDLLTVADWLDRADRFVFVDAAVGITPGQWRRLDGRADAFSPSLHQLEIGVVMARLEALGLVNPFPAWEVWGIGIELPGTLGEGLTPPVDQAVDDLVRALAALCLQNKGHGRE